MQGTQDDNNIIASYKNAIRIMTDELVVTHNVLAIPGIRDSFITDFAKDRIEEYGRALYLMEIPQYDGSDTRIFVSSNGIESSRPDVDTTSSRFNSREINSSYTACYFPDVKVIDSGDDDEAAINNRRVIKVPPTIVALGALAKTDNEAHPWFAPAGFSRGALESVTSIDVRLNAEDRDTLYEARINPIANFPNKQFVIFGQKTSQLARTALDRVNVRRLVLEVKRRIGLIAQSLLFEQNNNATRQDFIASATSQLASIQINQGIEDFRVVMDDTNNSTEDVDNNRLNGKIVIVPTRAVEFIAIDFVITNAGVEFP
jgi:phage tail sheath protein FI